MANPLVNQGVLNRLRGTVSINNFPQLNVIAANLGKEAIRLSFGGTATTRIPTMTGAVTSPEPYQDCVVTIHLLKTQPLSSLWEAQRQLNTVIGPLTVQTDTSTLGSYDLLNCSIDNVQELTFAGEDANYVVTVGGYLLINSALWNAN